MEGQEQRNYVYFVSFAHPDGFDGVEVFLSEEIRDINIVAGIANDIEENLGIKDVQVLNFVLLRLE